MQELTQKIKERLGDHPTPEDTLQATGEVVRDALRAGEPVEFLGIARLHLTADGLAGKAVGQRAITAQPMPGLLPQAETEVDKDDNVVIIAVTKTDPFTKLLAQQLTGPGQRAIIATGVEGVMESISSHGADVVVMDSNMELADEIRLYMKSTPDRSLISLICLYAENEDPEKVITFRICEDDFLVEPYQPESLQQLIGDEITRIRAERKYFRHEVSFQFPAQAIYQQQAADFMEKIVSFSGLSEEAQIGLVVAFREAVDNAIRHGSQHKKDSAVTVAYVLDREKVTVTVEDEGPGFDSSMYLETRVSGDAVSTARARHKEGRQGGLGIMLMLKSVDKLEYNREGNRSKLTKFLNKPAAVA